MIKRYCDKCGKELQTGEVVNLLVRVRGSASKRINPSLNTYQEFNLELCEKCAVEMISTSKIDAAVVENDKQKAAAAARKAAREKAKAEGETK